MEKPQNVNSASSIFEQLRHLVRPPADATARLVKPSPVPASDHVTLSALAAELAVEVERLRPLVDHEYLKIITFHDFLDDCIVARPYGDGMRWLKNLLAPLPLIPLLPLAYAGTLLNVSGNAVRRFCVYYDIPMFDDPTLGELITIKSYYDLVEKLNGAKANKRSTHRFDRQTMFQAIARGLDKPLRKILVPPYSQIIEEEIRRVRLMDEPEKGFRSLALYQAFTDAQRAIERFKEWAGNEIKSEEIQQRRAEKIENLLKNLMKSSFGPSSVEPNPVQPSDEP